MHSKEEQSLKVIIFVVSVLKKIHNQVEISKGRMWSVVQALTSLRPALTSTACSWCKIVPLGIILGATQWVVKRSEKTGDVMNGLPLDQVPSV